MQDPRLTGALLIVDQPDHPVWVQAAGTMLANDVPPLRFDEDMPLVQSGQGDSTKRYHPQRTARREYVYLALGLFVIAAWALIWKAFHGES